MQINISIPSNLDACDDRLLIVIFISILIKITYDCKMMTIFRITPESATSVIEMSNC